MARSHSPAAFTSCPKARGGVHALRAKTHSCRCLCYSPRNGNLATKCSCSVVSLVARGGRVAALAAIAVDDQCRTDLCREGQPRTAGGVHDGQQFLLLLTAWSGSHSSWLDDQRLVSAEHRPTRSEEFTRRSVAHNVATSMRTHPSIRRRRALWAMDRSMVPLPWGWERKLRARSSWSPGCSSSDSASPGYSSLRSRSSASGPATSTSSGRVLGPTSRRSPIS